MTKEELTKEAMEEMQRDRERNFKGNIKCKIRAIMDAQNVVLQAQETLGKLQAELKEVDIEQFDEGLVA